MLGEIIGAIGSIAGGLLGSSAADNAADQAWDRQKKVLKNQVQWRVADAVKAGLHPLAALGLNPASGPPMAEIGTDWGANLGNAGQDIGRAADALMTPADKTMGQLTRLQLERGQLENDLLRGQIASQRMRLVQQATPGVPVKLNPDGSVPMSQNETGSSSIFLPIPKMFGGGDWEIPVRHGGQAQQVADNWGDMMQELYGWYATGVDWLDKGYGSGENDYWKHYIGPAGSKLLNQDYFGATPDAENYVW